MIINARFSSACPRCGQPIAVGAEVEWSRGSKAVHVTCPGARLASAKAAKAPPQATAAAPSVELAPYQRGEKWEPCKRVYLPDTTGEVRVAKAVKRGAWAILREHATGEPVVEGDALIVVKQTAYYESAEMNEDCGDMSGPGWHVTLYLRRAAAEEAAPALERAAKAHQAADAKALRASQIKELKALCDERGWRTCDEAARKPAGREIELDPGVHGSGRIVAILSEDGGAVAVWCGGYYDDYRSTMGVTRDPRAAELFGLLVEGASPLAGGAS